MMYAPLTFQQAIASAVAELKEYGFDNQERVDKWLILIREAAEREFGGGQRMEEYFRRWFQTVYRRNVDGKTILKRHRDVPRYMLQMLEPQLRGELDMRIVASANLIKLNREKRIEEVLQRFQGWATSIPIGGSKAVDKREVKKNIAKSLKDMDFIERRVAIDQGHKLISNISAVLALQSGAIAATWEQHFTQQPRKAHAERNGKTYAVRGNWATEAGYMNKGSGYTDEFEAPAEFVFCRCSYSWWRNIRMVAEVAPGMITRKGREYLDRGADEYEDVVNA